MEKAKFIDIKQLIANKNPRLAKWLPGFIINYLRRVLHEDEMNAFLNVHGNLYDVDFCDAIIDYLNINVELIGVENIPKDGPVVIAMNHPLGGMDAIAFISAMRAHRTDMKFIVNDILMNLTNLQGLFVGVNKHGKNGVSARQQIISIFESDKVVCVFPAGLVSRKSKGIIKDLEWKKTFVTYSKKYARTIVPIHIDGKLSNFFYRLANFRRFIGIKANIEMLYLADELFNQRNRKITFTIGSEIQPNSLSEVKSEKEMAQRIKEHVYSLPNKSERIVEK